MTLSIFLTSLLLHGSAYADDVRCTKAHDPVKKGDPAPCTGVMIPTSSAIECSRLKRASGAWEKIFEKQQELSDVERDGLRRLLEQERKRTEAANARGDRLEVQLRDTAQELSDRTEWYESAYFWAPVAALVGVAVTVIVYESR